MFKKVPLRTEHVGQPEAVRKAGSRIGRPSSGTEISTETRSRRHSIAINENGSLKTEGEITRNQEQLIRGAFLVIKSQEEGIVQIGLEYVESLMRDPSKYTNILTSLFEEEIDRDAASISKAMELSVQRLAKISDLIRLPGNYDLDKQYLIMMEYFPERKRVEASYEEKVMSFCNKYPIFWKTREPKQQIFMRNTGETVDVKKAFRHNIFRDLATQFREQLPELPPYAKSFTEKKSYRKQLERVLLGMCDFDCFKWQYQSTAGSRTYLGSFSQSVERVCEAVHRRGPEQWEDRVKWKRFVLTYNLWKLYAALVAAEEFSNRLTKLYRGSVPPPRREVIDTNPGAYLVYATCSIEEIEHRLDFDFIIRQDSDGIASYLNIIRSYLEACGNIFDSINIIVQTLREIEEASLSVPPVSPASAPSSSRRRKITITEAVAPLPKSMEEIYAKFSIISPKIRGQVVALEQILV